MLQQSLVHIGLQEGNYLRMVPGTGTGRPQNGYGGLRIIFPFVLRGFLYTAIWVGSYEIMIKMRVNRC